MSETKEQRKDADALAEMRTRYQKASEHCETDYEQAREDIKFVTVPGNQWDSALKARRKNRPTYEFPKLRLHTQQVINEMRQSRPQGKVRGADESDRGLAEIMQGICRNIEATSNAEHAYDIAYEKAVKGGLGIWRICTDYLNDDDFEQDIRIKAVRNPFAVKFDPAAVEIDRRDGGFCFVEELIPVAEFERRFPDADVADFESDQDCAEWREAGQVRIAEYWYKTPQKRDLLALSDGRVAFADDLAKQAGLSEAEVVDFLTAADVRVVNRRAVDSHKVHMRLTNGHEWLTKPYDFPSKFIPVVPVWGNIENIDGVDYWSGMVRFAKDQQRLHNVHRSALVEAVAKAPKAPFILDPSWIEGYESMWKNANAEDYPYLLANLNKAGGNIPQRTQQAEVPAALIQLAGMDNDDMKAATGLYDASLGARSNETSGIAINTRKQQGATATFNYIDNLAYAIRYTYEILIDMIPRVYDTPRVVRVLGDDGGEKWKQLYQTVQGDDGQQIVINDIRKGKYDVAVTVGPSFATQRMEAVEAFSQLAGQIGGSFPAIGPLLAYQVVKNLDLPGSEEVDTALRKALVSQGLLPPKEGEEPPAAPPPDPRMEAQARKLLADAVYTEARAAKTQGEAQMIPAELQKLIAETVSLQLQNLMRGGPMPPPDPMDGWGDPAANFTPTPQPPQGGFFMPEA